MTLPHLETEDGARMTKGSSEASDTKPDVAGYSTGLSHPEFNACDREETSRVAQSPARSTNLEFCQSEDIEAITSSSDGLPSTVSTFEPPVTAAEVACVPRSKEPFASEMNSFASTPECRDARSCHLEPTRVTAKRRRVPDDSETPQTSPNKVQNQPVPRSHRKRLKHPAETTVDASKPMYNLRHTASRLRTRDTPNDPAIVSSVRAAVVVDDDDAATQAVKKRRRRTRRQSKVKARVCIDADHEVSPPRQANRRRTLRNVPRVNYAEFEGGGGGVVFTPVVPASMLDSGFDMSWETGVLVSHDTAVLCLGRAMVELELEHQRSYLLSTMT
ncbi:unnamed protein product [Mesocestoides corti]|uniref:Uncharacterized protein n=1 Tax=Mesocestoides corti TaxID=53468 RepID=A0A0R3UNG8_MESCO|nr:unnamed protein product [Mesocestoides corti]